MKLYWVKKKWKKVVFLFFGLSRKKVPLWPVKVGMWHNALRVLICLILIQLIIWPLQVYRKRWVNWNGNLCIYYGNLEHIKISVPLELIIRLSPTSTQEHVYLYKRSRVVICNGRKCETGCFLHKNKTLKIEKVVDQSLQSRSLIKASTAICPVTNLCLFRIFQIVSRARMDLQSLEKKMTSLSHVNASVNLLITHN